MEVLDLGLSPLANNLLHFKDESCDVFELKMLKCNNCHNCQLSKVIKPEKMFKNYLFLSSTASKTKNHFFEAAEKYIEFFKLDSKSKVVDIGSNDGTALFPFKQRGIKVIGVDPAENICKIANNNGIYTINNFFNKQVSDFIYKEHGLVDLVIASNVFAHADNIKEIAVNTFDILKDNGTFIVEAQYLLNTIKDLTFDNIYHEHVNYWSLTSLNHFFKSFGFIVYKCELIDTHGGSIRVYVSKNKNIVIDSSMIENLILEENFGITKQDVYTKFSTNIQNIKNNIIKNINILCSSNIVAGYGSHAKATTALNYYEINDKHINFIIEDNELKHGRYIPNAKIPIVSKTMIDKIKPNIIIVFAWNYYDEILKNNTKLIEDGIKFINIKDLENENFDCSTDI
jgi:2-polyprenyl-3-methyl-5-hydroxy-6-metoxy-1,4-benzoquinol methylase